MHISSNNFMFYDVKLKFKLASIECFNVITSYLCILKTQIISRLIYRSFNYDNEHTFLKSLLFGGMFLSLDMNLYERIFNTLGSLDNVRNGTPDKRNPTLVRKHIRRYCRHRFNYKYSHGYCLLHN